MDDTSLGSTVRRRRPAIDLLRDVNGTPFPANPWGIHLLGDGYGKLSSP
jgi:hypothetical protein